MSEFSAHARPAAQFSEGEKEALRKFLIGVIYFGTLVALGAPLLKSAAIAAIVFAILLIPIGRRILSTIAVILLLYSCAVWLDAAPQPPTLKAIAAHYIS